MLIKTKKLGMTTLDHMDNYQLYPSDTRGPCTTHSHRYKRTSKAMLGALHMRSEQAGVQWALHQGSSEMAEPAAIIIKLLAQEKSPREDVALMRELSKILFEEGEKENTEMLCKNVLQSIETKDWEDFFARAPPLIELT